MGISLGKLLGRHFGLVFGLIWLVVGIGFVIGGAVDLDREQRFARSAETTEGTVLTRTIRHAQSSSGSGSQRSTEYWVGYRFRTAEGDQHEGRSQVSVHLWEELREQGPVAVQYLPSEPRTNRLAEAPGRASATVMAGLGAIFALAGAGVAGVSVVTGLRRGRLRRDGRDAEAVVTAVQPTNFRVNQVAQWRIHYRYRGPDDREHIGRSPLLSPDEARSWKEGDVGRIRYDPVRPEVSVWLDDEPS